MLWMVLTVIPYTLAVLLTAWSGATPQRVYRVARAWLKLSVDSARVLLGIRWQVHGMEHLPADPAQGVVLLVKHQSTYETFLLPAILPRPLAFVFKKELLWLPFFGWSIGSLDMIHIDRKQGARAFFTVVEQGKRLLAQGTWVIMFPEGTRIARGQQGEYKTGATRLAIMAGAAVVPIAVTSAKCWPRKRATSTNTGAIWPRPPLPPPPPRRPAARSRAAFPPWWKPPAARPRRQTSSSWAAARRTSN